MWQPHVTNPTACIGSFGTTWHTQTFPAGSITSIVVRGGGGPDRINVVGNPGVPVRAEGGDGDDQLAVNEPGTVSVGNRTLANLTGVTVTFEGGGGTDSLVIDDRDNSVDSTYEITSRTVTGPSNTTFHYNAVGGDTMESVTLNAGTRVSTVNVRQLPAGAALTVNGGDGADVVNVGTAQNRLDDVRGSLTIDGQGNSADVTLNDQGALAGRTYMVGSGWVTVSGVGTIRTTARDDLRINARPGVGDTLAADTGYQEWEIRSVGGGDLSGRVHFTGMNTLTGGASGDRFILHRGASIGSIDGGAAEDRLDYWDRGAAVSVNLQSRSATGIGSFVSVERAVGTGFADTVSGDNRANDWSLTTTGTDVVRPVAPLPGTPGAFSLESFETFVGGTAADRFLVSDGRVVAVTINGGGGSDTLDLSAYTAAQPAQTWNVRSTNGGDLNGLSTFSGVENLIGGSAADTFRMHGATPSLTGRVTGGSGADTLDYSGYAPTVFSPATVDLGLGTALGLGGFDAIESFVGGTGSFDRLTGTNNPAAWRITGLDLGTVGATTFAGFENLFGGTQADSFYFTGDPVTNRVRGTISGGANPGLDTLDYSGYTGASAPAASVNLETRTATAVGVFAGIERFTGGAGADTLTGENLPTAWNVTVDNGGNLARPTGTFYFSAVEHLAGGSAGDKFVLSNGRGVSGSLAGGAGTDKLDYSAWATGVFVNLASGQASGVAQFAAARVTGIENVTGTALTDSLTGDGSANVLIGVGGADKLDGAGGRDFLVGGDGVDTLFGGAGEDIMVGGSTLYDGNDANLAAIMAEWQSSRNFGERRACLLGQLPGGLNGSVYLDPTQIVNDMLTDFTGDNLGPDWGYA